MGRPRDAFFQDGEHGKRSIPQDRENPEQKENEHSKLTATATVVAERAARAANAFFHRVEGNQDAGLLVHKKRAPRRHSFRRPLLDVAALPEKLPDVVPEGAEEVNRAPGVHERLQAIDL